MLSWIKFLQTWRRALRIKPEQPSHWYKPDGTPAYGATLREARKQGLYPSVTSIGQVFAKPAITAWSDNLLLDAAWNYTVKWATEDEEEWKERVIAEWRAGKSQAAELGSAYHDAIEEMMLEMYDGKD
jgi:hypothetical protein